MFRRSTEEAGSTEDDDIGGPSHIKFIHDYFEKLSLEADEKLLDSSFYKPSQLEIAKSLSKNYETFKPKSWRSQDGWAWLHEASRCFHIHLRNASIYHKFQQNLKNLTREVENIKENCMQMKKSEDVSLASENTRNMLEKLLKLQSEVDQLHDMSHKVVPIHLRKLPCRPHNTQPVLSIGSYYDIKGILIEENSQFHLLDNSDARKWKVRRSSDQKEMNIPSLLFIFPSPDAGLMQDAYKLRWHLLSVWKFCVEEAKRNLSTMLVTQLDKGSSRESQQLAAIHKRRILEILDAAKNLLNGDHCIIEDASDMENKIQKYAEDLSIHQPNVRGNSSLSKEWIEHQDLTENIKEMDVYMKTYAGSVASQACSRNHLIRNGESNDKPQFKSCAYIQRWPEERTSPKSKLMMIYEVGNSPSCTSNLRGEVEEVVEERLTEHTEETQFTSQTIKETQKFFIRGVFDPRTGKNISNHQAIDAGIIDLKRGLYRNPVSGEDIRIQEAMDRGLIVVEYSNKSVEMGELIKSGIFKTTTRKEIISYVILSIKDPRTGKNISVTEALKSGLIDQEQGRFILNDGSGDDDDGMSIESAINKGFLEVKELNRRPIAKEEPSNVKVVGVYDMVGKQFVSLQQALRKEVMDRNTAALRNKATGEVIPLKEAVKRGLVLLEISPGSDANSLENFPVLGRADFDEIVESVAEGYSADPIVELVSEVADDSLFYDPSNGEQMSLKRAIISERVGFNPLMVTLEDGTKFSLQEALLNGILDLGGIEELLKVVGGKRSLMKLAEDGRLDLKTGDHVDLKTRQRKSLQDAAEDGEINPSLLFYWDDQSQVATSLKASLNNGRLKNGKVFNFEGNDWLTMEEAVNRGLIRLDVNSDELIEKYSSVLLFKDLIRKNGDMRTNVKVKGLSLADSIMRGELDVGGMRISTGDGDFLPLSKAVEENLIEPKAAREIMEVAAKNDLNNFFTSHKSFDPSTSRMEHPNSGRKITFLQAVKEGIFVPDSIFMLDCTDGGVKSVGRMAREGKFNLETGKVKDIGTGRERSLAEAMKNGLVVSSFDPDSYLEQSRSVEYILREGSRNKFIKLKNGERLSLEDAFAGGLLDPQTKVKPSGRNGEEWVLSEEGENEVLAHLGEVQNLGKLLDLFGGEFNALKMSDTAGQSDLENLRNQLKALKADLNEIMEKFDETDSFESSRNLDKLKNAADKLHNNFQKLEDDLDEEINKRAEVERKISQAFEDLERFRKHLNDLEDEYKLVNRKAADPKVDLNKVIQMAENMDMKLQPKLEELLNMESKYGVLVDLLKNSDQIRAKRFQNKMKEVNESFNKLSSDLPQLVFNLSSASKNYEEFQGLEKTFLNKKATIENDISNIKKPEEMDREERTAALRELNGIGNDLLELSGMRNDLEQLKAEVDSGFKRVGRPSDAWVIKAVQLEYLERDVASLQDQLNRMASADENRKSQLQRIKEEISNLERVTSSEQPSLDRKKLMQLEDQLVKRGRTIEVLKRELLNGVGGDNREDEDLIERLERIDERIQSKREKIMGLNDSVKEFNEAKESLINWMKGFTSRVNKKDDPRIQRMKISKLNEEKHPKEMDLKGLNATGWSLMTQREITNQDALYDGLHEVNKKWDGIIHLLNQYIIVGASGEMEKLFKYLEEVEAKMNSLDPITINRDGIVEQLKSHQKFHSDLMAKKASWRETAMDYSRWLNNSLEDQSEDVKMNLEAAMERLNAVAQSSTSRLICLEDAATLATHFDESLSDLKLWLNEAEANVISMETTVNNINNNNIEQCIKLQEQAKMTCHEINDRSEAMEVLKGTGLELKELCNEREVEAIDDRVLQMTDQYARVREVNRKCLLDLQDIIYNSNDEAFNVLLAIQSDLNFYNQSFMLSFPSSLNPSILFQQITDLQTMHDDILKVAHIIGQVQQEMTPNNSIEEMQLLEELIEREKELERKVTSKRQDLESILKNMEEFENVYAAIMSALQGIQDNLSSQDHPGMDFSVVSDQINEVKAMEEELHNAREMFNTCDELVDKISDACNSGTVVELQKLQNNRDHIFGNVLEGLSLRRLDLNAASDLSRKYAHHLENVADWLPKAEERLAKVMKKRNDRSSNMDDVDDQLCHLKRELMASFDDIVKLKDVLSSFKIISPLSTDVLMFEVKDIEGRFNALMSSINGCLASKDVDHIELLQNLIQRIPSDRLNTKEHFWSAKLLKENLNILQGEHFSNFPEDAAASQQLLDGCHDSQEKMVQLRDGEQKIEELLKWVDDFKNDLIFLRALRSQASLLRSQVQHFDSRSREFEEKASEAEKVMDGIKSVDGGLELDYLVNMLQESINNAGDVSIETERKLKEHLEDVEIFHSLSGEHSRRMSDIEMNISHQPLKSLPNIQELESNLLSEKERMQDMLRHGSALKFFGRKQDSIAIGSSLLNSELRWNRAFRRLNELKNRSSEDQNQREKFRQQHSDLLKTFEEIERKVNDKNLLKDLMILEDEISLGEKKLHALNHTLRNMKGTGVGVDNDLHSMVLELKRKWNSVHNSLINKKNKLDLDLITSGKLSEAIKVQCDWLLKCVHYLDENQPLLGDLDTVSMLIDQYKNFQEDLKMHESLIESIRSSNPPPASVDQLNSLWDEVIKLNEIRRDKLHEAHGLATEFQEAVEKVRRILPEIEEGLRETGGNVQSEEHLLSLMDHHQKLYTELCNEQPTVERIVFMSDEIMGSCHPSATRFMQYYLTITQKRWEQAMMKSNSILEKLNDSLKRFQGGATVVDDLWAWLSEAQQLLTTKSKDPLPNDLTTVDALIRDHQDFHEDLINKNEEIEAIVEEAQLSKAQVQMLQNKWRSVWRLSVERKKVLQETLDHLLEMESLNNFNFEEWKQRYNSWIKMKMLRVTDFFRKQDTQGYGTLTRSQFVNGMINSKFPSNKMELNAVFDLFKDPSSNEMLYKNLIEALKPERMGQKNAKAGNPSKFVDDEVVTQISKCQCRKQFAAYKLEEGKYQFGEKGKTHFLRFVNGAVMVRVGGGWVNLAEFLQSNDPCRAKNRTNIEIYRTLQDRRKSTSSLNKSVSGSVNSLTMVNQQVTPKRSRTPQTTSPMKGKNVSLNHSMTSLVSAKSKDSDPQNVNKSSDSLKVKPVQKASFMPPKRAVTPKTEYLNTSKEVKRTPAVRPTGQR